MVCLGIAVSDSHEREMVPVGAKSIHELLLVLFHGLSLDKGISVRGGFNFSPVDIEGLQIHMAFFPPRMKWPRNYPLLDFRMFFREKCR